MIYNSIKPYYWLLIFVAIAGFTACNSHKEEQGRGNEVARVFESRLYEADIAEMLPDGIKGNDSALLVTNYINNWIRQELLLHKAELNLDDEQKNVEKQLEDYRNSLVIYLYEKEFVRQRLDTIVSDEEIEKYYEENKGNFELKDNIVKVLYVKLDNKAKKTDKLKKWLQSGDSDDRKKLEEYCVQNAEKYFFDDDNWILFDELIKEVPIKTYNKELFLKNNRFVEVQDSLYIYFVNIKDFQVKETTSPLSFQKENIKNIIINTRKLELVKKMEEEIYEEAINKNYFEIYNEN